MAYGLNFTNDTTGELILSDQAPLYRYIGRAGLVGITQSINMGGGFHDAGQSTYQIYSEYSIAAVVALQAGYVSRMRSFDRSGNTWTINVSHCLPSGSNSDAFPTQIEAEVHVFAAPAPYAIGAYGAAIYDNNQNVIGDLSQIPLTFLRRVYIADGVSWSSVGSGVKPGILGFGKTKRRDGIGSRGSGREAEYDNCWELSADGTLFRPAMTITASTRLVGDDAKYPPKDWPRPTSITYAPARGILLNLTGL